MSPGGAIFVPSPPKTGTNLRHPPNQGKGASIRLNRNTGCKNIGSREESNEERLTRTQGIYRAQHTHKEVTHNYA